MNHPTNWQSRLGPARAAATPLAKRFESTGHRLYLVGGVIREAVLGRDYTRLDLDCTTDAVPEQIKDIVAPLASAVWTQGERYGTIGCLVGGRIFEITTHRSESYEPDSRKPFVDFAGDLQGDLARRDFTVNAMAMEVTSGRLADPFNGLADLASSRLRTPLDPRIAFGDDPLRMLRAGRFVAGYDLTPDPSLIAALRDMAARIGVVSAERIRDEVQLLLLCSDPTAGLRLLAAAGLLARILPGYDSVDIETSSRVVAALPETAADRWAGLLADLPSVAPELLRAMRCGTELIAAVTARLAAVEALTLPALDAPSVRRLVRETLQMPADSAIAFARPVFGVRGGPSTALGAFETALAGLRCVEQVDDFEAPLDGSDVMAVLGLDPGPDVGLALNQLREIAYERGPIGAAEATRELQRWWAEQRP